MNIIDETKEYYGKIIKQTSDLKTDACCENVRPPEFIIKYLKNIHEDITNTYYGCGLNIPDCLEKCNILDLGCGTGRDVYLLSQMVGEEGTVTGIDMTDEQIEVAIKYMDYHLQKFNLQKNNVFFYKSYIENMNELNLKNGSYDIIVSNCVVNLCQNKEKVFKDAYDLLKEGGEFYFSDVYSSNRISKNLRNDKVLWGECLSGALYWNDFVNLVKKCGFTDPRLVKYNEIGIKNKEIEKKVGITKFYSATYRLFKLPNLLDSDCEDYGQAVIYLGTIPNYPDFWDLDGYHRMNSGKVFPVCGNTYNMLYHSRFNKHFTFIGDFDTHYGLFDGCGKSCPFKSNISIQNNCC